MYEDGHQAAPPWSQNTYFKREHVKYSTKGLVCPQVRYLVTDQRWSASGKMK